MPFPLAHPAAVLPLRRCCPRFLSFSALIVGSLSPDVGYCFKADQFSHRLTGSIGFCLPVGVIMLVLLYGVLLPAVERLPHRYRRMVPPVSSRPLGPPFVVLVSLLIGAWTHLLWDSFTHKSGWFVEHLPLLEVPVASAAGHSIRIFHVLWYGSSFVGMLLLFLSYDRWRQTFGSSAALAHCRRQWLRAALLAVLVLPIELIHHVVHGALGLGLVAALTLALMVAFVLNTRPAQKSADHQIRLEKTLGEGV